MVKIRLIGILVLFFSLIFAAMHSIGSNGSNLYTILAYAGLCSLISGIGIFFLKNWARIYSAIYLTVSVGIYLLEMIKDYGASQFLPSILMAGFFSVACLVVVIVLFSGKVRGNFK